MFNSQQPGRALAPKGESLKGVRVRGIRYNTMYAPCGGNLYELGKCYMLAHGGKNMGCRF